MEISLWPKVILLAGPTASGKSAVALNIARSGGGEIVNADSMQVYRELYLLSARPSDADDTIVPHHLYGDVSVTEAFSVGRWVEAASSVIADIASREKVAIIAGGTGLYFDALLNGLSPVPEIDPDIRRAARTAANADPLGAHAALRIEDPAMAARLEPADSQRVARALEVVRSTGKSLADWQSQNGQGPLAPLEAAGLVYKAVLMPPRDVLYQRCDDRFDSMMTSGALDEVAALPPGSPDMPAFKALGVPELQDHLAGNLALDEAIALAKTATRQYAKRQMTWFRNRFAAWDRLNEQEIEKIAEIIFSKITKN